MKDFKNRLVVSSILTIPVLALSPMIQGVFSYSINIPGSSYPLSLLSTIIFFYGSKPFLVGMIMELRLKKPGMMTLVALAISVAFFYSLAVTFLISGRIFYWELALLIDVMLLGHYVEMRALIGASRALEALVKLMPCETVSFFMGVDSLSWV